MVRKIAFSNGFRMHDFIRGVDAGLDFMGFLFRYSPEKYTEWMHNTQVLTYIIISVECKTT